MTPVLWGQIQNQQRSAKICSSRSLSKKGIKEGPQLRLAQEQVEIGQQQLEQMRSNSFDVRVNLDDGFMHDRKVGLACNFFLSDYFEFDNVDCSIVDNLQRHGK